jgi:hypothetical protein
MKLRARNVAWLLPFFLTACFPFQKKQPQQVQALAPPVAAMPKPAADHPDLPESAITIPDQPIAREAEVQPAPKPPPKHRKPPKTTQQASNTPPAAPVAPENPGVSAIGQLSSGDPSDLRRDTVNSIAATERGLNGLGRNLNDQEQKTAGQIREYLKQAREALVSGDVDGAHTLSEKAKVLLGELSR